jgi:hypothetical protein
MSTIKAWSAGRYAKGAVVYHDGAHYQASSDTAAPPPSSPWQKVERRYSPTPCPPGCSKAFADWREDLHRRHYEARHFEPTPGPRKPVRFR